MEITEANYEEYRDYYNKIFYLEGVDKKETTIFYSIAILGGIVTTGSFIGMHTLPFAPLLTVTGMALLYSDSSILKIRAKKKFKKEHPNFDINIDLKKLRTELRKFEEKSDLSLAIEKEKEARIQKYSDMYEGKSTSEILETLKEEREFWEKVLEKEQNEKEKVIVKEIR